MIVLLDTSHDLQVCASELGCEVGQLLTPLTRYTLRQPELPWAIDNGAYSTFDERAFLSLLKREDERKHGCKFVTAPDVVGSVRRTLEVFEAWHGRLDGWKIALAIQDGQESLPIPWESIGAVFVGGTTPYKTSPHVVHIIKAAKALGKWVHVGRVNDPARFSWCEKLGVDSVDGTGLSRYTHMRQGIAGRDNQEELFAS